MAAGAIGKHQWKECASAQEPGTKLVVRYVICNDYAVRIELCPMHRALWDADYERLAVWAGAPVADSAVTR